MDEKQRPSGEVICHTLIAGMWQSWDPTYIGFFLLHYATSQKKPTAGKEVKRWLYVGIPPWFLGQGSLWLYSRRKQSI